MRLETHAVDSDLSFLQLLDEAVRCGRFFAGRFQAVVVVEEFDVLSSLLDSFGSELVRQEEVFGPDGVVPDAGGKGCLCLSASFTTSQE